MGEAAEYLVAATCILASRGKLDVATQLIDDEGIDLWFSSADAASSLAVQVMAWLVPSTVFAGVATKSVTQGGTASTPR
jgi:hypothetical protein